MISLDLSDPYRDFPLIRVIPTPNEGDVVIFNHRTRHGGGPHLEENTIKHVEKKDMIISSVRGFGYMKPERDQFEGPETYSIGLDADLDGYNAQYKIKIGSVKGVGREYEESSVRAALTFDMAASSVGLG